MTFYTHIPNSFILFRIWAAIVSKDCLNCNIWDLEHSDIVDSIFIEESERTVMVLDMQLKFHYSTDEKKKHNSFRQEREKSSFVNETTKWILSTLPSIP